MEHPVTTVWVDPSWLSWYAHWDAKWPVPNDNTTKLYEMHQHACDLLSDDPNEFKRIDAITALRRVVDRRVNALLEIHQLRELPTGPKPKQKLELLEYYGIIRPFMLKRLIDIRNIVEHEDSSPPPVDECLMFADLVWYLLRSTDGLAKVQSDMVIFRPHDATSGFFQLFLSFEESFAELEISALLPPSFINYAAHENWIKIESAKATDIYSGGELVRISVQGKVKGTPEQMKQVYEICFGLS